MPEPVTISHGFLVKDVKHIARNDGNLIGVVLHAPHDADLWSAFGAMLDEYFNVTFMPQQGELDMEGGEQE
jgi:hypothetical protein